MKNQINPDIQKRSSSSLNKHILSVVTLAFFLLMAYFLVSDYFTTINHAEKLTLERLQGVVNNLAVQIDGDIHQRLSNKFKFREDIRYSEQNEDYEIIHDILDRSHEAHSLGSPIYTFIKPENTKDNNNLQFIATSSDVPYYRHWYSSFPESAYNNLDKGGTLGLYKDEYGHWLSAFAPIKNKTGETIAYVQADEKFDHFINEVRTKSLLNAFFCMIGFSIVIIFLLPYLRQVLKAEEMQKSLLEKSLQETQVLSKKLSEREEQLKENAKKLEQNNKDLTDFAHLASHDLKAPIRNIHSFSQLILHHKGAQLDETAKEYMGFITQSADRAQRLINGLLSYSTADKDLGNQVIFPMCDAIKEARHSLTSVLKDRNAQVIFESMGDIKANPTLVSQILQNLINNGIKYNQSETPVVEVGTSFDEINGRYFFVKDNGIGIPQEYQKNIFKMFTRLHSSQEYEGSGIGLAFCNRVVAAYGGKMWLESIPDKGSIFFFTLPNAMLEPAEMVV